MPGKLDETLRGIDEALDVMDVAVKGMGDTVNTARGQMSHVSLVSSEAMHVVSQARQQVFKLADTLDDRRVQKAIAFGITFMILLANLARVLMPAPGRKKKRR